MGVKKEINWDMVELNVKAGCSQVKIAESFCIDRDTLRDRVKEKYGMEYSAFSASLRSEGQVLAESIVYQKALKGHWPSLHWFLQVQCGQRLPEPIQLLANNQPHIDQSHRIMELEHALAEAMANADKSKTE